MNRIIAICFIAVIIPCLGMNTTPTQAPVNYHLDVIKVEKAIHHVKIAQMEKVKVIVNDSLRAIEIYIKISEGAKKNASHCYHPLKWELEKLSDEAFASIRNCCKWDENIMPNLSKEQIISLVTTCSEGPIEILRGSVRAEEQMADTCIRLSK